MSPKSIQVLARKARKSSERIERIYGQEKIDTQIQLMSILVPILLLALSFSISATFQSSFQNSFQNVSSSVSKNERFDKNDFNDFIVDEIYNKENSTDNSISRSQDRSVNSLSITSPLYFQPLITTPGTTVNITANADGASSSTTWKAFAHSKYAKFFLTFISATNLGAQGASAWKVSFSIPQNVPKGVYNITLSADEMQDVEWHCLAIVQSIPTNLKFAHITDTHISDTEIKNNEQTIKVIEELNLHAPDIVIFSGDLTNGGSFSQFRKLRQIFLNLDAPIITCPGNHDHYSISNYYKYVNPVLDYSYDLGQYHFVSLNSGPDVSGTHEGLGLTNSQISFLTSDLSSNAGKTFIVFLHHPVFYDSKSTISQNKDAFINACKNYNVKMVLSGHVHGSSVYDSNGNKKYGEVSSFTGPIFLTTVNIGNAFRDDSSLGYRIVQMNGANVNYYTYDEDNDGTRNAYAPIPYNLLNISYSSRTTSSGNSYSAVINNNLNEDLTLRVHFEVEVLLPGLDYNPNGGTKLFTTRNFEENKEHVFVSTFVGKRSSKTVELVPAVSSIPDLSCAVSGSTSGSVGTSASFTVTVKTTEAVSQSFRVSLFDVYKQLEIDYKEIPALGKDSQQTLTLTWTPQNAGYTQFSIVVDSMGVISEPNEWNNLVYIEYESLISGNLRPTADAGNAITGKEDKIVHFYGLGNDSDGNIVRYEWDFDGDGTFDYVGNSGIVDYIYDYTGNYTAKLRVYDDKGARGEDTVSVRIIPMRNDGYLIKTVAELMADPQKYEGMAIMLYSVIVVDPKNYNRDAPDPNRYTELDVADSMQGVRMTVFLYAQTNRLSSVNVGMKVDARGQFSLYYTKWELKISSNTGDYLREASETTGVPNVNAGSDKKGKVGVAIIFNGSAWDDDGYITKYEWDYDNDGRWDFTNPLTAYSEHEYDKKGIYTAILRATDDEGNSAKASITVTIEDAKKVDGYGWTLYVLIGIAVAIVIFVIIGYIMGKKQVR